MELNIEISQLHVCVEEDVIKNYITEQKKIDKDLRTALRIRFLICEIVHFCSHGTKQMGEIYFEI